MHEIIKNLNFILNDIELEIRKRLKDQISKQDISLFVFGISNNQQLDYCFDSEMQELCNSHIVLSSQLSKLEKIFYKPETEPELILKPELDLGELQDFCCINCSDSFLDNCYSCNDFDCCGECEPEECQSCNCKKNK